MISRANVRSLPLTPDGVPQQLSSHKNHCEVSWKIFGLRWMADNFIIGCNAGSRAGIGRFPQSLLNACLISRRSNQGLTPFYKVGALALTLASEISRSSDALFTNGGVANGLPTPA
jgi:hypothetical protein